ncbi:hypothetical protein AVEN_72826-1 [Araneus ventricosus]|uniref:Uncharacterized protein n=1 Tax=Araneus ventricosus TaxID=182803 RepID=A0A4Y2FA67_ARAVE|nr:hypothetical protein AVEN_72826-1 [Araneus ventricosus]
MQGVGNPGYYETRVALIKLLANCTADELALQYHTKICIRNQDILEDSTREGEPDEFRHCWYTGTPTRNKNTLETLPEDLFCATILADNCFRV